MAFISTEVSADAVLDAMNDDANFCLEVWQGISERAQMGMLRDNLSDLAMSMTKESAQSISASLRDLANAVDSGHQMANGPWGEQ